MCTNPIYETDGSVSILLDNVNNESSKCKMTCKTGPNQDILVMGLPDSTSKRLPDRNSEDAFHFDGIGNAIW